MQQTIGRLAAFVLSVALLAGLGVSPATAKSIDQGCEIDAMRHDSVSDELCATEDSPIDDSRTAKSETKSTRNVEPRNVDPEPRPIRTITEGQSTTFTVPTPVNRQVLRCVIGGVGFVHPTTPGVTRPNDKPFTCRSTYYGLCLGPYTVEITSGDDRLSNQPSGQRIRVTTNAQDDTNDAGTLTIPYVLHGTRTQIKQPDSDDSVTTRGLACTLLYESPVTVKIIPARRPGMTAAVALHAPSREYLSTPSTTTWECTQALIDKYVNELNRPAPCTLNDVISTTVQPTFDTPRGCVVVVTVAKNSKGFGSTNCLTSAQIDLYEAEIRAKHPDEQAIDVSDLPTCPESTHTDVMNALPDDASGRKRCVARN